MERSASNSERFIERLTEAVKRGKVFDVSNMDADGYGYRVVNVPTKTSNSMKWVDDIPIISNNYTAYKYAMDLLGPDYDTYSEQFLIYHGEHDYRNYMIRH